MSCTWRPGPDDELARIAAAFGVPVPAAADDDDPAATAHPPGPPSSAAPAEGAAPDVRRPGHDA